jgi:hypothetical protein
MSSTGATGVFGPLPVSSGFALPAGFAGPTGPMGVTGFPGTMHPEKHFPALGGKPAVGVETEMGRVEIWVGASIQRTWHVTVKMVISLRLTDHDGVNVTLHVWETEDIYAKEPEVMASKALNTLGTSGIESISREEMSAMFVVARKEAMRAASVLFAELHVGHLSREETAQAWDDANALSVMTE